MPPQPAARERARQPRGPRRQTALEEPRLPARCSCCRTLAGRRFYAARCPRAGWTAGDPSAEEAVNCVPHVPRTKRQKRKKKKGTRRCPLRTCIIHGPGVAPEPRAAKGEEAHQRAKWLPRWLPLSSRNCLCRGENCGERASKESVRNGTGRRTQRVCGGGYTVCLLRAGSRRNARSFVCSFSRASRRVPVASVGVLACGGGTARDPPQT